MTYSKPEIVEVGAALDAIQWNLEKGPNMGDSQGQGSHTPSAAYQSDE